MRRPAGLDYPQPDDLHMKLTSEAYVGSLQCPLSIAAILPAVRAPRPSRVHRGRRLALIDVFRQGPGRCPLAGCLEAWPEQAPEDAARPSQAGVPRPWWNRDQPDGAGRQWPPL